MQDSAVIIRLYNAGFNVADCPICTANCYLPSFNYDDIITIAVSDLIVSSLDSLNGWPTTFELTGARVVPEYTSLGSLSYFIVLVPLLYISHSLMNTPSSEVFGHTPRADGICDWLLQHSALSLGLSRVLISFACILVDSCGLVLHNTGLTNKLHTTLDVVIVQILVARTDS